MRGTLQRSRASPLLSKPRPLLGVRMLSLARMLALAPVTLCLPSPVTRFVILGIKFFIDDRM